MYALRKIRRAGAVSKPCRWPPPLLRVEHEQRERASVRLVVHAYDLGLCGSQAPGVVFVLERGQVGRLEGDHVCIARLHFVTGSLLSRTTLYSSSIPSSSSTPSSSAPTVSTFTVNHAPRMASRIASVLVESATPTESPIWKRCVTGVGCAVSAMSFASAANSWPSRIGVTRSTHAML